MPCRTGLPGCCPPSTHTQLHAHALKHKHTHTHTHAHTHTLTCTHIVAKMTTALVRTNGASSASVVSRRLGHSNEYIYLIPRASLSSRLQKSAREVLICYRRVFLETVQIEQSPVWKLSTWRRVINIVLRGYKKRTTPELERLSVSA